MFKIMIMKIIANIYEMFITCLAYVSFYEIYTYVYILFYTGLICEVTRMLGEIKLHT